MRDERTVYRLNTLTEFPMVVLAWIGHQPDPTSHQHDAFCGLAKFLIQMDVYTMDKLGLPCNHRSVRDQADIFRERIPQRFGPSFAIIRDHGCLELLTSDADRDDGARDAGDERSTRGQKRDRHLVHVHIAARTCASIPLWCPHEGAYSEQALAVSKRLEPHIPLRHHLALV